MARNLNVGSGTAFPYTVVAPTTADRIKSAIVNLGSPLYDMGYLPEDNYKSLCKEFSTIGNAFVAGFTLTNLILEAHYVACEKVEKHSTLQQSITELPRAVEEIMRASYVLGMLHSQLRELLRGEELDAFPVRRPGCELYGGLDVQRFRDLDTQISRKAEEANALARKLNERMVKLEQYNKRIVEMERMARASDNRVAMAMSGQSRTQPQALLDGMIGLPSLGLGMALHPSRIVEARLEAAAAAQAGESGGSTPRAGAYFYDQLQNDGFADTGTEAYWAPHSNMQ